MARTKSRPRTTSVCAPKKPSSDSEDYDSPDYDSDENLPVPSSGHRFTPTPKEDPPPLVLPQSVKSTSEETEQDSSPRPIKKLRAAPAGKFPFMYDLEDGEIPDSEDENRPRTQPYVQEGEEDIPKSPVY